MTMLFSFSLFLSISCWFHFWHTKSFSRNARNVSHRRFAGTFFLFVCPTSKRLNQKFNVSSSRAKLLTSKYYAFVKLWNHLGKPVNKTWCQDRHAYTTRTELCIWKWLLKIFRISKIGLSKMLRLYAKNYFNDASLEPGNIPIFGWDFELRLRMWNGQKFNAFFQLSFKKVNENPKKAGWTWRPNCRFSLVEMIIIIILKGNYRHFSVDPKLNNKSGCMRSVCFSLACICVCQDKQKDVEYILSKLFDVHKTINKRCCSFSYSRTPVQARLRQHTFPLIWCFDYLDIAL